MQNHKALRFLIGCAIVSLVSFILALSLGAVHFKIGALFALLLNQGSPAASTIIWHIRLPVVANAFIVGGLLSLAGILMQALLRNPLADPYILGVSGGAAVATLLGLSFGVSLFFLHCLTYLGAILAITLVFALARSPKYWSPLKLLLTGVVLAAGWGAIISFILTLSPNNNLHGLLFWLIGNIQTIEFSYGGLIVLLLGLCLSLFIARPMDLLLHGEITAKMLGVNLNVLYGLMYLLSALLTATAVSIAGTIGFVGLIVPHMIRLCIGSKHCWLIPTSILVGGSLLVLADTLARTLIAPEQLPVGIFTVFMGVPIFLYLLLRSDS